MTEPSVGKSGRLLVVEDNATLGRSVARALAPRFSEHALVARGDDAILRLADPAAEPFDVVVTDMRLPGADGMDVLRAALARDERCAVVVMTAHGSVDRAVEAMRSGAADFLSKPFDLADLEERVEHARAQRRTGSAVAADAREPAPPRVARIIGKSPELLAALDVARRAAPSRSTVLLTGETGTGKELVAELVHRHSPRVDAPFVKVNCAALPETLLESELFGHERGAFTSADRLRVGRFEQADGGTLFLDEVGDMSLATQAKLLRVLQDQEFQRLGGSAVLRTDVRIVAATNRNLEEGIASRDFREDLYFRLNVIRVALPPLRERPEDIELLAECFRADFAREVRAPQYGLSPRGDAAAPCPPVARQRPGTAERGRTRRLDGPGAPHRGQRAPAHARPPGGRGRLARRSADRGARPRVDRARRGRGGTGTLRLGSEGCRRVPGHQPAEAQLHDRAHGHHARELASQPLVLAPGRARRRK